MTDSTTTSPARRSAPTRRDAFSRLATREMSLLAVLAVILVAFSLSSDRFLSWATISQILSSMSIVMIVGTALALVLMTRNIDVSVGSMVGLSAYVAADVVAKNPGIPTLAVVGLALGLGLLLGAFNGVIVATLKVPSIMVTLGTLYIYRGVTSMLAGSNQVTQQSLSGTYEAIVSWSLLGIPALVVYAFVIAFAAHLFIRQTFTGRSVLAIGSNPLAAEKVGIPSRRIVFGVFVISGVLCGFAGVLWGARFGTVTSSAAVGFELVVLAAVVVGGISVNGGSGSIIGVIIGAAILSVISTGLGIANVSQFWLQAIQGLVIVTAIVIDAIIRSRVEARGGLT
jgi:rhamnose transport system permease protein